MASDKTYSLCFQLSDSVWRTNWHCYSSLTDINWKHVAKFSAAQNYLAYGYMYGHHSCDLTAKRCRTILKRFTINPTSKIKS